MALCFPLVLHCPTRFSPVYAVSDERQSFAKSSGWLGNNVQQLLEVLVRAEPGGCTLFVAAGASAKEIVAYTGGKLVSQFTLSVVELKLL